MTDLFNLPDNTLHVWQINLTDCKAYLDNYQARLQPNELRVIARLVFDPDRERALITRAILRGLLAHYTQLVMNEIEFIYGAHGKPEIKLPSGVPTLRFNISHSHEILMMGFTRKADVGIDIEYERDTVDYMGIAQRYFSDTEIVTLQHLPLQARKHAFFNAWTRKEAVLKALGTGLSLPLREVCVTLAPHHAPALRILKGDKQVVDQWQLWEFEPHIGYTAAAAIHSTESHEVIYHHYNPEKFDNTVE